MNKSARKTSRPLPFVKVFEHEIFGQILVLLDEGAAGEGDESRVSIEVRAPEESLLGLCSFHLSFGDPDQDDTAAPKARAAFDRIAEEDAIDIVRLRMWPAIVEFGEAE